MTFSPRTNNEHASAKMQARPEGLSPANEEDLLSQGIDEILAEHNGDVREAIRALLAQISYLELARNEAIALASFGYASGKLQ
jgi:hypothetical protein